MVYLQLLIFLCIAFVTGAVFGSFLCAACVRFAKKETLRSRSYCDHCKHTLGARDLVPIMSFIVQGGKCRYCKHKISLLHPLVEIALGWVFLYIAYTWLLGSDQHAISFIIRDWYISWVLMFIFVFDLLYMHVEDKIVVPAIGTIFIISGIFGWQSWGAMLAGLLAGGGLFLVQYLLSRGKWVGSGDIFIGMFMGVVLGWPSILTGLFLAYIFGASISVILMIFGQKQKGDQIPMGIYLAPATFVAMFWGDAIMSWYLKFL